MIATTSELLLCFYYYMIVTTIVRNFRLKPHDFFPRSQGRLATLILSANL